MHLLSPSSGGRLCPSYFVPHLESLLTFGTVVLCLPAMPAGSPWVQKWSRMAGTPWVKADKKRWAWLGDLKRRNTQRAPAFVLTGWLVGVFGGIIEAPILAVLHIG